MKLQMKQDALMKDMKVMKQFLSIPVNVLTCDYNDFYKLKISQEKKTCEIDAGQIKSMYSHVTTLTFVHTCDYIDHNI